MALHLVYYWVDLTIGSVVKLVGAVRYFSLVVVLVILKFCSSGLPGPDPASPEVVQGGPTSDVVVSTAGATVEITSTPAEVEADRTYEQGVPLAGRVNDQPIFLADFEKRVSRLEAVLKAQGVELTGSEGEARLSRIRQQVFETLLDQVMVEQQAGELGIQIEAGQVKAKAQETVSQVGSPEQFEQWLATNQLSEEEFLASLQAELLANALFDYVTKDVPDRAEQVQLQYTRVEAEEVAQAILERYQQGESFALLAETSSLDERGGDLIWLPRKAGLLPLEVEEAAFALQPGEVSEPIQTPSGFYLVRLEGREMDRPLPEDQLQLLKRERFSEWLDAQRASTIVERFVAL